MALETLDPQFGNGGAGLAGQGSGSLYAILRELRGLKFGIYVGVANGATIAITGMTASDTVLAVMNVTDVTNLNVAQFTPGSGTLTNNTGGTLAAKNLIVVWADKA